MSYKLTFNNNAPPPLSAENMNLLIQTHELHRAPMFAQSSTNNPSSNTYTFTLSAGQSLFSENYGNVVPLSTGDSFTLVSTYGLNSAARIVITDGTYSLPVYPLVDIHGNRNPKYNANVTLQITFNNAIVSGGAYVISSGSSGGGTEFTGNTSYLPMGRTVGSSTAGTVNNIPELIGTAVTNSYDFVIVKSVIAQAGKTFLAVKPQGEGTYTFLVYDFPTPIGGCELLINPIILQQGDTLCGYCEGANWITASYTGYKLDGSSFHTYHRLPINATTYASRKQLTIPSSTKGAHLMSFIYCNIGANTVPISSTISGVGYLPSGMQLPAKSSIDVISQNGITLSPSATLIQSYTPANVNTYLSYIALG